MGCANGSGVGHVFDDGEVIVEGVVLGNVGEEVFEAVEGFVEGVSVEEDGASRREELSGDGAEERGLAGGAGPHDANHFASGGGEGDAVEGEAVSFEAEGEVTDFEGGNGVPFFFEDTFSEVAAEDLSGVEADGCFFFEVAGSADVEREIADVDGTVGVNDFEFA